MRIPRTSQTVAVLLTLTGLVLSSVPCRVSANKLTVSQNAIASISDKNNEATPATAINGSYAHVGLKFEANHGQSDPRVKFITRGPGYTLFLTPNEATFRLFAAQEQSRKEDRRPRDRKSTVLRMKFEDANKNVQIDGRDQLPGVSHYFKGRDRSKWLKNIPSYQQASYKNLYPAVDLVFYGREENLEYDFVVGPTGNPADIKLAFDGAENVSLDQNGNLILKTARGAITHQAPIAYQDTPQGRRAIESRYTVDRDHKVRFAVAEYDRRLPLVIDPVMRLTYSTYFGGKSIESAADVAVDLQNQAVIAGFTASTDFPANNADPDVNGRGFDAFVTKFNADGTGTIYSVYIGGRSTDEANAVAVDPDGNVYITGETQSLDFPTTPGVVDERGSIWGPIEPEDCFVTKLDREGLIVYSTFLAGNHSDIGEGIAVDPNGRAYVTGSTRSARFPVKNQFQNDIIFGGSYDGFITVLNSAATGLIYSSYFGGYDGENAKGIAIDADGNAYISGTTKSNGTFPLKSPSGAGPFQTENAGNYDAFVAKFNPFEKGEKSLIYSTFVGGSGLDQSRRIAVDSLDRAYVVGDTDSPDFPLAAVPNAQVLDSEAVGSEAFLFRINADGSALSFSTFYGGEGVEETSHGVRVDPAGNIYIVGFTGSIRTFPIVNAFQPGYGGGGADAFVAKLAPDARQILYSSYLGGRSNDQGFGVAIDAGGNAYVAGFTISEDYPVINAIQPQYADEGDCFLTKIGEMNPDTIGVFKQTGAQFELRNSNTEGPADIIPVFGAPGDLPIKGDWDGDGIDTVGVFRPSTGQFFLAASNVNPQVGVITINFGQATDLPVAGDWDGDGDDEIGVFNGTAFTLRSNTDQAGFATTNVTFGAAGDIPVAGDFDGNGLDTVGVWRPSTTEFFLTKSIQDPQNGVVTFQFGLVGDLPVIGDWNGDGIDTIGVFGPPRKRETFPAGFFLRNSNTAGLSDLIVGFGQLGDRPVAGDWDGQP